MIYVDILPCVNCKNFDGIKQPNKQEREEFASCKISETKDARDVFDYSGSSITCKYKVEEE